MALLQKAAIHGPRFPERISIRSPLEHYSYCRFLLSASAPRDRIQEALAYPYAQSYQPSIGACALLAKQLGCAFPPLVPRLLPSGAPCAMAEEMQGDDCLLPISIAEELALLWQELGLTEAAEKAKNWAARFTGAARMLYLREEAFLAEDAKSERREGLAMDRYLGLLSTVSEERDIAFSLTGWNSALGAMRFGDVVISAFGPQMPPLSDARGFGISHLLAHGAVLSTGKNSAEIEGWTRCHGCQESWLHLRAQVFERSCDLALRLTSSPSKISFFISARRCDLGNSFFEPGSLQRYQGKIQSLFFNHSLRLDCKREDQELQIIPLAGKDCFWNASFLISYTCPPGENISFRFTF